MSPPRILVLDTSSRNLRVIERCLRALGYDVCSVAEGERLKLERICEFSLRAHHVAAGERLESRSARQVFARQVRANVRQLSDEPSSSEAV
jgi:CheY-like chemotaxis protein